MSPGELFWLDPCYRKMDQHLLLIKATKKLPMAGWGGQPLHQDCPFSMQQPQEQAGTLDMERDREPGPVPF